tara:strand:+ start:409 stop:843 length:435 start_codon:yes stop_codon:yes gene_type:complete
MKKLLLILLCLPLLFTTCKKEEENSTNNNTNISIPNIVGVWKATSLILDGDQLVYEGLTTCYFHVRSNMTFSQYADAIDGSYEYQDGTWELSGSSLEINFDTYEYVHYNINSLNSTTASLILVEYLNDSDSVLHLSGSCNLVKQ